MLHSLELRYLEGGDALRERIKRLTGREPNSTKVSYVSSCLLHGRLFWESAESAPLETRPLLLYYGAASFARALIESTSRRGLELTRSHGLSCVTGERTGLAEHVIAVSGADGLFHRFNDVVALRNRVQYYTNPGSIRYIETPTAASGALLRLAMPLHEILARLPDLKDTYQLATGHLARCLLVRFYADHPPQCHVNVIFEGVHRDAEVLRELLVRARAIAPFLNEWRMTSAETSWGKTTLFFENVSPPERRDAEISNDGIRTDPHSHEVFRGRPLSEADARMRYPLGTRLGPMAGGFGNEQGVIEPFDGHQLSEYSLMLMALLGMSSIVRYAPHVWTSAVHRRPLRDRTPDDTYLPVIEAFLARVTVSIPALVTAIMLEQ